MTIHKILEDLIVNSKIIDISKFCSLREKRNPIGVDLEIYDSIFEELNTIIKYYEKNTLKGVSYGGEKLKISCKYLIDKLGKPRLAYNWRDNYTLFLFDNDRIEIEVVGSVEIIDKKIIITDPYGNSKSYNIEDFYFNSIKVNL